MAEAHALRHTRGTAREDHGGTGIGIATEAHESDGDPRRRQRHEKGRNLVAECRGLQELFQIQVPLVLRQLHFLDEPFGRDDGTNLTLLKGRVVGFLADGEVQVHRDAVEERRGHVDDGAAVARR